MSGPGTILITGANRGFGHGLALEFVRRGWRVFGGCRNLAAANGADGLEWVELDVCNESSVCAAVAIVAERIPGLDVLVNNAGINPAPRDAGVVNVPVENVARALDVNALGPLRMLQAAAPLLRLSLNARVVNISSGAGSLAHNSAAAPLPAYCMSKAALNMLTRRAARELADITVVSVSPGWIRTDMGGPGGALGIGEAAAALADTIEGLDRSRTGQWLDRFGKPSDYAW